MGRIWPYTGAWEHIRPGSWLKVHTHAGAAGLLASYLAGRGPGRAGHGPGPGRAAPGSYGPGRAGPHGYPAGRAGPRAGAVAYGPRPGPARCPPWSEQVADNIWDALGIDK